jgi:hypothetical protein
MHFARLPFSFALDNAGKSMEARIAMMAITTNSSISVNATARDAAFMVCSVCLARAAQAQRKTMETNFMDGVILGIRKLPFSDNPVRGRNTST